MFCTLFEIYQDAWDKPFTNEVQVGEMIVNFKENEHLYEDTISKFAKSVKDVIHIEGDTLSYPSQKIKLTPSFLEMSGFTDILVLQTSRQYH